MNQSHKTKVNRLPLSDDLYLIHSPSAGEGKTRAMAKGLILCFGDVMFAGESAGFGLPVMKINNQTVFPSLASSRLICSGCIQAVYRLNLFNTWQISGLAAPSYYSSVMERMVAGFMKKTKFQQPGLKIRNILFQLFQIRSSMKPGKSFGYCRVLYKAIDNRLEIRINGQELNPRGELIFLNEASGTNFCRMVSGRHIRDNQNFLPWQNCALDTVIENINDQLGFSISVPENPVPSVFQLAAGREVGRDLNWAGLMLSTNQPVFTYSVCFHIRENNRRSE